LDDVDRIREENLSKAVYQNTFRKVRLMRAAPVETHRANLMQKQGLHAQGDYQTLIARHDKRQIIPACSRLDGMPSFAVDFVFSRPSLLWRSFKRNALVSMTHETTQRPK
jgi:hypothetical protein